jgi:hypothetical protein
MSWNAAIAKGPSNSKLRMCIVGAPHLQKIINLKLDTHFHQTWADGRPSRAAAACRLVGGNRSEKQVAATVTVANASRKSNATALSGMQQQA